MNRHDPEFIAMRERALTAEARVSELEVQLATKQKSIDIECTFLDNTVTNLLNFLNALGIGFKCFGTEPNTNKIKKIKAANSEEQIKRILSGEE